MSVLGSANGWADLLDRILPDLLSLLVDAWTTMKGPLKDSREDTVTEVFCRVLRQHRTLRDLPLYIIPQMVELEPMAGEDLGRLDIAFLPSNLHGSPNESIYFCLECKWLNVVSQKQRRPGGSDYVRHGMQRFVTGQYAKAVKHGGMIGYVQDGNIESAIQNVQDNVSEHCANLCMTPPGSFDISSVLPHVVFAKESIHFRNGEDNAFRIHHLFMNAEQLQSLLTD